MCLPLFHHRLAGERRWPGPLKVPHPRLLAALQQVVHAAQGKHVGRGRATEQCLCPVHGIDRGVLRLRKVEDTHCDDAEVV